MGSEEIERNSENCETNPIGNLYIERELSLCVERDYSRNPGI